MSASASSQPTQPNGVDQNQNHRSSKSPTEDASAASGVGNANHDNTKDDAESRQGSTAGSGGGFTAVNGISNKSTTSSTSPPSASLPNPAANGHNPSRSSVDMERSSPPVNAIYPRRPSSSPESTHSPPIRKRSYNEALGDDQDDSSPKKEETYSEGRKTDEGDSRHSGEVDDQKLASEALRREQDMSRRESTSLNNEESYSYMEYERTSAGALIDMDRKKRKRVFSNRTKTGCMTCRKRKKKCDEMHPECNNCLRGGFVCEGYSQKQWHKPNPTKLHVPLQSKEGPSTYQHSLVQSSTATPGSGPVRYTEDYTSRPDLKPLDDSRRLSPHREPRPPLYNPPIQSPAYNPAPHLPQPSGPYGDRAIESRQPPLPKSELHDHQEPSYSSASMSAPRQPPLIPPPPPLHSTGAPPPPPPPPPPPGQQHHPQHHPQAHPQHHQAPPPTHHQPLLPHPPPSMAPPIMTTPPQRPVSHHRQESERDKMLRGEYFLPYTPALMADREQCALAVWRFNNSTIPTMGIKLEERMNYFRDIVNLRPSHDSVEGMPDPNDPTIVGSVGTGVIVEAPFSCDYGYNISIGNDVVIGADCRITDTCSVHIGNNVVFSPGVRLMCATYAIDPRERKKGKGRALGRQIVIEDDVWIGSNVIILPGVKIGRATTIGAGSLLHKDVPPGVVVAGNPPKVVRGIYDDGSR